MKHILIFADLIVIEQSLLERCERLRLLASEDKNVALRLCLTEGVLKRLREVIESYGK